MVNMNTINEQELRDNHQEALNRTYKHFITDKRPFSYCENSEDPNRGRYRGDDGTACPVGLLMTDEEYSPDMEGKAPMWIDNDENPMRMAISYHLDFLFRLSDAHDQIIPVWREGKHDAARLYLELELAHIATDWKLNLPQSSYSPN